jgi:hypothetical protein
MTATATHTATRRIFAIAISFVVLLVLALAPTAAFAAADRDHGKPVAPPKSAPATPNPATQASNAHVDADAAKAMAKQHGISVEEATHQLGREKSLGDRGKSLEKALRGRTGGSFLDEEGNLVVTTLDAEGDQVVSLGGGRPQRVDDSATRLDNIMRQLDHASEAGAGSLQGWFVDVPNNSVVVTVTEGATDARTKALTNIARSFGDSVRIETAPASQQPKTTAYMVGGFEVVIATGGTCSAGFNTRDAYGRNVVLTAGHCTKSPGMISRQGYYVGNTRTANFPADDYGTFWNSYPSYWTPSVSVYKYNGTYVNVRGQWNAPTVGATVCKSGRTTGYTCGAITALNQTVVYTGGQTVYGLVRHNACVQGGDSGGSNISSGAFALGVTSGASMTTSGLCLSKVGQANVSWYQPIGEALSANGLSLLYQP